MRFASYVFHWYPIAHTIFGTYMTMSIRVKRTAAVPSEAIPRGISYLGTKGGSDDKVASSSVDGAFPTLRQRDQKAANPVPRITYFLFQYAFMTAAVAENHLSTMANMNTPTHVPKIARFVLGIHGPNRTLSPGVKWRYVFMVPPSIPPPISPMPSSILSPWSCWASTNDGKRYIAETNARKDIVVAVVMEVSRGCAWELPGASHVSRN